MFKKILIANRGEIACRIMRTCRDMGIMTVAVYSDADQDALHASIAGECYYIGASAAGESYLNQDKIIPRRDVCQMISFIESNDKHNTGKGCAELRGTYELAYLIQASSVHPLDFQRSCDGDRVAGQRLLADSIPHCFRSMEVGDRAADGPSAVHST